MLLNALMNVVVMVYFKIESAFIYISSYLEMLKILYIMSDLYHNVTRINIAVMLPMQAFHI